VRGQRHALAAPYPRERPGTLEDCNNRIWRLFTVCESETTATLTNVCNFVVSLEPQAGTSPMLQRKSRSVHVEDTCAHAKIHLHISELCNTWRLRFEALKMLNVTILSCCV